MDKNKRRKEWEAALDLMTEELDFITEHPVGYYPSFYEMARMKQMEMMDDPNIIQGIHLAGEYHPSSQKHHTQRHQQEMVEDRDEWWD